MQSNPTSPTRDSIAVMVSFQQIGYPTADIPGVIWPGLKRESDASYVPPTVTEKSIDEQVTNTTLILYLNAITERFIGWYIVNPL